MALPGAIQSNPQTTTSPCPNSPTQSLGAEKADGSVFRLLADQRQALSGSSSATDSSLHGCERFSAFVAPGCPSKGFQLDLPRNWQTTLCRSRKNLHRGISQRYARLRRQNAPTG